LEDLPLIVIAATFVVAGLVKGVIGLGLPTITLAALTVALDLPQAMALLLIPSFVTNLWQGVVGGNLMLILRRLWPFLVPAVLLVWVGGLIFAEVDHRLMTLLLGVLVAIYAALNLAGIRLTLSRAQETWAGPVLGVANGVLTGMTGSFVMPGVMFLQAIGLSRDVFLQAMGVLFTLSTIALAVALQGGGMLSAELCIVSLAGVIPALIGMVLGQQVRKRLSEALFRKVFFWALLALGLYIIANAL
jgi:uncharacterized protein